MKLFFTFFALLSTTVTMGAEPVFSPEALVKEIGQTDLLAYPVGVTADRKSVFAAVDLDDFNYHGAKTRVLLVGHSADEAKVIAQTMLWFYKSKEAADSRKTYSLSAIPLTSPDGTERAPAFPPPEAAYADRDAPELQYLWRWIGMHAPDLVVEVKSGDGPAWFVPSGDTLPQAELRESLHAAAAGADDELASALVRYAPCETGRIAAARVTSASPRFLADLFAALESIQFRGPSPARRELQERLDRTPLEVAGQLSVHYGHKLPQVVYIPAMALVGRLQLGELTGDASHMADVQVIAAPYVDGAKETQPKDGSALSGHLIFAELAQRTEGKSRARYVELARNAADLALGENGELRDSMPYHLEMSDSLFMGGPILAHVGDLTGDARYFDACLKHLRFMRNLVLRDDGLYRHSPLDEAAWGRGNGFPALGLALCLSHWPEERNDREQLLAMFRNHIAALKPHQDESGCWRQVIDRPDSYRELSCTCMITFAAARGVREGWLDRDEYDPMIQKAWSAIRARVAASGSLVDVCTGTGKQKSLDDYYRRPAILGHDDRGGAMALLAATEMASYSAATTGARNER
jgi:rhamnogalacturonyl hydrolase YesR